MVSVEAIGNGFKITTQSIDINAKYKDLAIRFLNEEGDVEYFTRELEAVIVKGYDPYYYPDKTMIACFTEDFYKMCNQITLQFRDFKKIYPNFNGVYCNNEKRKVCGIIASNVSDGRLLTESPLSSLPLELRKGIIESVAADDCLDDLQTRLKKKTSIFYDIKNQYSFHIIPQYAMLADGTGEELERDCGAVQKSKYDREERSILDIFELFPELTSLYLGEELQWAEGISAVDILAAFYPQTPQPQISVRDKANYFTARVKQERQGAEAANERPRSGYTGRRW